MTRPLIDGTMRKARYENLRDDLAEVGRRIEEVEETADSPDGLISATVVRRGELVELYLDPRIYRTTDSKALAESIVDTIGKAVRQAQEKIFDITRDYLPPKAKFEDTDIHTGPFLHQLDKKIEGA